MPETPRHGARISMTRCGKTFAGGVRALLPTDVAMQRGEIVALLGPSGCGKTTILRIIAGLEAPDPGGRVMFDDEDVTATPIEHRNVGMVFQSYALFPNMNVRGNVGYGLKVRRMPRPELEGRVDEVLELCRITELADRRIDALSGGQRQRVALARAVAVRPRVLLLDEPLSALDAALREQLRDELAVLLRELSISAVFVTHDQSEAMAIADRVVVMQHGRVHQVAPPRELYAAPADSFVAGFVGGATALGGELRDGRLHLPGGSLPAPVGAPAGSEFFVRPEALRLVDVNDAPLRGEVSRCIFLGDRSRVTVVGAAATPLTVDLPGSLHPAVGDVVGLDADAGALMPVMPDDHGGVST